MIHLKATLFATVAVLFSTKPQKSEPRKKPTHSYFYQWMTAACSKERRMQLTQAFV